MNLFDLLIAKNLSGGGGGGDITTESLSVNANGTYRAPSGKAYTPVTVNVPSASGSTNISSNGTYDIAQYASAVVAVPNSYTASDEGKVVFSGALVAQTSQTIDTNGTYDTTLKDEIVVNVSGGGGGGITADEIAMRTISGVVSGNAIEVKNAAFKDCTEIIGASFPSCISARQSAFYGCTKLASISMPNCKNIEAAAFGQCTSLETVNFPKVESIGNTAFQSCSNLLTADFSACEKVGTSTFLACTKLQTVTLGACTSIGGAAFSKCYNLVSLYLTNATAVPSLASTTFNSTPIGGYTASTGGVYGSVFVPASLYNSFLTAQYWSAISARIVSVS